MCKIKQNSKCAKNLKYTIFEIKMFVQFSVLVLVLPSSFSFWGCCWWLVRFWSGWPFPVVLHKNSDRLCFPYFIFFFLAQTLFAQDVDDGGLARFARSARLPEEMENNLYLDSYSYSYPYLYLFEIYIRNKTMSVQLAVA